MKTALLVHSLENGAVQCDLCAHECTIPPDGLGICRVRANRDGRLVSLNFDRVIAANADPIEKKPLYHFLPGTTSFSVAAMGCNFRCSFCQNHSISQLREGYPPSGESISPEHLVDAAIAAGCRSMAYTYTEPTIFFELMLETATIARDRGLKNVMVTNGYMSEACLDMLAPVMDGANVDLKAFSDKFYRKHCGARLQPVLDTLARLHTLGIWLEVTTLLIPELNTDSDQITGIIGFLHELDPEIPWHVSRYFPQYRMKTPATPLRSIQSVLEQARQQGLAYVYGGNIPDGNWTDTRCPGCGEVRVKRRGYQARVTGITTGNCAGCGQRLSGVWE